MSTAIYCHECGGYSSSEYIIVRCDLCNSRMLSFKMSEDGSEDIDLIGFVSCYSENLSWTEFGKDETIIYTLRKNYSVIPTLCYDINNGIIIDPINEDRIDLKNLLSK